MNLGARLGKVVSVGLRMSTYSIEQRGSPYSMDYRIYFKNAAGYISPFHDIPLYANSDKTVLNMVVEIPRWTNAKMEISTSDRLNPIKQDVKKGNVRFVNNCFPYHGYMWNYGAFPQTWECPGHVDPSTNCKGDNDPLDVVEIGSKLATRGEVKQVKVIGILAMIDEGETDWKIIAIDINDPLASSINDVPDLERVIPSFIKETVNWFRIYKMPTGKPPNEFAFNGMAKDKAFANGIIEETHQHWSNVIQRNIDLGTINITNTTLGTSDSIDQTEAATVVGCNPPLGNPHAIPEKVDDLSFVHAE